MKLIYGPSYSQLQTKYLVFHHFGGIGMDEFASTKNLTAEHLENAHAARWPGFRGSIINPTTGKGYHIGYNGVIFPGTFLQTRAIGEETAAAKGWNQGGTAIHFVVAGNFNRKYDGSLVDQYTEFQKNTMREIADCFPGVTIWNYVPHRALQSTQCFGTGLTDDWARKIIEEQRRLYPELPDGYVEGKRIVLLKQLAELYTKLIELLRKTKYGARGILGSSSHDCDSTDVRG